VNITADKLTYFTGNVGMDIDGIPERGALSLFRYTFVVT
jgi:hypothetical protein